MHLQSNRAISFDVAALVRCYKEEVTRFIDVSVDLVKGFQCCEVQSKPLMRALYLLDMVLKLLKRQGWTLRYKIHPSSEWSNFARERVYSEAQMR